MLTSSDKHWRHWLKLTNVDEHWKLLNSCLFWIALILREALPVLPIKAIQHEKNPWLTKKIDKGKIYKTLYHVYMKYLINETSLVLCALQNFLLNINIAAWLMLHEIILTDFKKDFTIFYKCNVSIKKSKIQFQSIKKFELGIHKYH